MSASAAASDNSENEFKRSRETLNGVRTAFIDAVLGLQVRSDHMLPDLALLGFLLDLGANADAVLVLADADLAKKTLRWRADSDKIGFEHTTPLTDVAVAVLAHARADSLAIGDMWIFPATLQPGEPTSRYTFFDWWERAEKLANIARVKGRGWHSLRRQFANELRHVPLRDLATLGGWKEPMTVLKVYQCADEATMRAALNSRRIAGLAAVQ